MLATIKIPAFPHHKPQRMKRILQAQEGKGKAGMFRVLLEIVVPKKAFRLPRSIHVTYVVQLWIIAHVRGMKDGLKSILFLKKSLSILMLK